MRDAGIKYHVCTLTLGFLTKKKREEVVAVMGGGWAMRSAQFCFGFSLFKKMS